MGCFFGCFGIKESRSIPVSSPEPAIPRSNNALSSLFNSDDDTLLKGEEGRNAVHRQLNKELKNEVKLKTEIQKDSVKENDIPAENREEKSSTLSSWFSNKPTDKLKHENQSDSSPLAVRNHEDPVAGTSSISPLPFTPGIKPPAKSVRFASDSNQFGFSSESFSSECIRHRSKQSVIFDDELLGKQFPHPTPLKLTDEMQTPGTEFPAYINRSQYGCSVSNPVETSSSLKDKHSSNHFRESLDEETLIATPILGSAANHHSVGKDTDDEGSLSSWFKPVSIKQDGLNKPGLSVSDEKVSAKTAGDRPIIGMVAAYWSEDEAAPPVPPKWWDGNGIPNSTNKYKEDQKVSWHATPFEERLEKALSEEPSVTQRNPTSSTPPFDFNETEESDTALSRLHPPSHTKPVISF